MLDSINNPLICMAKYEVPNWLILLSKYDIPNWLSFVITLIFWPSVLFLWGAKKYQNIPNLEVSLVDGMLNINGNSYDAIWLKFSNQTGSIVYLSNLRLLKCTKLFKVPIAATRSFAESSYELNFSVGSGNLDQRQIILNTNCKAETAIALDIKPGQDILSYQPPFFRKLFHYPKYFRLEYTAMVGTKRYIVSTNY